MKAGVIGHPISHSKSPLIHQYWLSRYNLDGSYIAIDIGLKNLNSGVQNLVVEGFEGFNVTIPHKQDIINLCDEIDEKAKAIGAVNTVTIKNGQLFGSNTDAFGFIENIKSNVPNFVFKGKTAFVLGAGGAARAILYGLIDEGVQKIKLSNRSIEKAQALQETAPDVIEVVSWDTKEKALSDVDLLVNSTSLGMVGQPELLLNLDQLPTHALVNDIVYTPLITDLLNTAKLRGNLIVTGIGMLLHQARPSFKSWTDILPEVTQELEKDILG